jgi:putative spermidine/putrescine transport system permease protein
VNNPTGIAHLPRRRLRGGFRLAPPRWAWPAFAVLAIFFVMPLAQNAATSVTAGQARTAGYGVYYLKLLTDPYYLGILAETLQVGLITTLVCLVLGYPIAFFIVRFAGRWKGAILFCLIAPLLTSIIMRTFGWRVLLARRGIINATLLDIGLIERPIDLLNNSVSVYVGLVHVLIPFMVLSIAAVIESIDTGLEESARILGAGRLRAFLSVTLPLSLDGITTGAILVFVLTNGSFITMLMLGGGKVVTLPLLIYQQFNLTQDVAFASAMGNVLLVAALICLALQIRLVRRRGIKS